jgi:hypothetical protein
MSPDPAANAPLPNGSTTAWNRRENLIGKFEQAWERADRTWSYPSSPVLLQPPVPFTNRLLISFATPQRACHNRPTRSY